MQVDASTVSSRHCICLVVSSRHCVCLRLPGTNARCLIPSLCLSQDTGKKQKQTRCARLCIGCLLPSLYLSQVTGNTKEQTRCASLCTGCLIPLPPPPSSSLASSQWTGWRFFFFWPSTSLWGVYSETFIHRYSIPLAHAFTRLCMIFPLTCTSRTMPLPLGYSVHNFRF